MSALTQTRDHARAMAKKAGDDQALWTQIADEIDEYLAGPTEHVDLFGDTTTEPEALRRLCDPPTRDELNAPMERTYGQVLEGEAPPLPYPDTIRRHLEPVETR